MILLIFYVVISLYLFFVLCRKKIQYLLFGVTFYSSLSKLISTTYLDNFESVSIESAIHNHAYSINSSYYFFTCNILMYFGVYLAIKKINLNATTIYGNKNLTENFLVLFSILLMFVLLASIFYSNFGTLFSLTRHQLVLESNLLKYNMFGSLLIFIPFIIGMVFLRINKINFFVIFLCSLYFLFLFLTLQKFHGFLFPIVILGFFLFVFFTRNKIFNKKIFFFSIISILVIFIYSVLDLSNRSIVDNPEGLSAFWYRFLVLQGSAYHSVFSFVDMLHEPSFNLLQLFDADLLKEMVLGAKFLDYDQRNVNLSMGLQASSFFIGGYYGIIIFPIYGFFVGLTISSLVYNILHRKFFLVICLSYIWLFNISIYATGNFSLLLQNKFYIIIVLLTFFTLLNYYNRYKKI